MEVVVQRYGHEDHDVDDIEQDVEPEQQLERSIIHFDIKPSNSMFQLQLR